MAIRFILVLIVISSTAFIVQDIAKIPIVITSYSTDKCVKVINYNQNNYYDCYSLPEKYNHEYIK